ncbi:MAG: acetyl-CoA carboxylase carboxyltransferase subunit alpha [Armatimonadetes bacterium]|nr:acetyl-CoA carboxylase carboxyltransferase subunit alpha [Armatimonadota bacterium]
MRFIPLEQPLADLRERQAALEEELRQSEDASANGEDTAARRAEIAAGIEQVRADYAQLQEDIFASLTPLDRVQLARHPDRPYTLDYVAMMCRDFCEMHGDRRNGDDGAVVAGMGMFRGDTPVGVVGHQKGRSVAERKLRNFGLSGPGGYRKGVRIMQLAARFGRPVLAFVDTAGAACTPEAEETGISEALASSQLEMARLPVPIVATVIGEGGSGGAIAFGVADHLIMLEYSYYAVLTPEGCASIIWRDASLNAEAADALRLSAADAFEFGFCDEVIEEPRGGAHRDPTEVAQRLETAVAAALARLSQLATADLLERRYQKFRAMGRYATV